MKFIFFLKTLNRLVEVHQSPLALCCRVALIVNEYSSTVFLEPSENQFLVCQLYGDYSAKECHHYIWYTCFIANINSARTRIHIDMESLYVVIFDDYPTCIHRFESSIRPLGEQSKWGWLNTWNRETLEEWKEGLQECEGWIIDKKMGVRPSPNNVNYYVCIETWDGSFTEFDTKFVRSCELVHALSVPYII